MQQQNNLVFLCGPHGSGKTTLGDEIAKQNQRVMIPELYSRNVKFNTDPKDRLLLKVCGRSVENFEYLDIAKQNPEKIIIGNRCIYDQQTYNEVYHQRGWVTDEELWLSNTLAANFYIESLRNPNAIVLNPGFDIVTRHLQKRWKEKGKKWNEDDQEYTRLACELYEKLRNRPNVFYIDHEINLESKVEIIEASEWLDNLFETPKSIKRQEIEQPVLVGK